jgi:hypothetical protein
MEIILGSLLSADRKIDKLKFPTQHRLDFIKAAKTAAVTSSDYVA